ncbi:hypothetical protein RHA1_ro03161 [Rhodococcus jostii RHA1]|uniref:Uncharacterized protein n=1 Tax=Rhodococcus jostii (strain RHA1) TaxID=101510 RepID=Q0SBX2_RHOJR|nr:hypothetical protein RHA1_ro03161 [Rhodococcus jostii RHA1]
MRRTVRSSPRPHPIVSWMRVVRSSVSKSTVPEPLGMFGSPASELGAYRVIGEERFPRFRMWHGLALEVLQEFFEPFRSPLVQSGDATVVRHGFHYAPHVRHPSCGGLSVQRTTYGSENLPDRNRPIAVFESGACQNRTFLKHPRLPGPTSRRICSETRVTNRCFTSSPVGELWNTPGS